MARCERSNGPPIRAGGATPVPFGVVGTLGPPWPDASLVSTRFAKAEELALHAEGCVRLHGNAAETTMMDGGYRDGNLLIIDGTPHGILHTSKPRIPRRNFLIEPSGGCRAAIGPSCVFRSQPLNHWGASWK